MRAIVAGPEEGGKQHDYSARAIKPPLSCGAASSGKVAMMCVQVLDWALLSVALNRGEVALARGLYDPCTYFKRQKRCGGNSALVRMPWS